MTRDWKEDWVDRMGLIVALSGEARFQCLVLFKLDMATKLSEAECRELRVCLRKRFMPTNGQDGCQEAVKSVREATT